MGFESKAGSYSVYLHFGTQITMANANQRRGLPDEVLYIDYYVAKPLI